MQLKGKKFVFFGIFLIRIDMVAAQKPNNFGLFVETSPAHFRHAAGGDTLLQMRNLKLVLPNALIELPYATGKNFTHRILYDRTSTTYGRAELAAALQKAAALFAAQGLGIKIWDAYRPYSATETMWKVWPDENYAANPAKGSGHNRGIAVDLTLYRLGTAEELDMGTGFDNFTDTAHVDFVQLPKHVLAHRKLLKETMEAVGLKQLPTEWWHFFLPNASRYPLMDFSFRQMGRLAK